MPAFLRLPNSIHPDWWHPMKGFSSLADLQAEKRERYWRNAPPFNFDPAWMIEPTIAQNTDNGVKLWKWSNAMEKWRLDAEIIWRDSANTA